MFNSLEIVSISSFFLRCLTCKEILFRQDDIKEYLCYDPEDFGKLKAYANREKCDKEAHYLILNQEISLRSTFQIDYTKTVLTEHHPFFMMHMFFIKCSNCKTQIGYEVQTVNENTIWMQGKFLINAEMCSIIKDGRDQMSRLIKNFHLRLLKKLEISSNQQKQKNFIRNEAETQAISNLQKLVHKPKQKEKTLNQKREKLLMDYKKRNEFQMTTNACTAFSSKVENPITQNSHFQSSMTKNEETSFGFKTLQSKIGSQNGIQRNDRMQNFVKQNQQSLPKNTKFAEVYVPLESSIEIARSLSNWRQQIIEEAGFLSCKSIVEEIFQNIAKIQANERYIFKKIPTQYVEFRKSMSMIRKGFVEKMQQGA